MMSMKLRAVRDGYHKGHYVHAGEEFWGSEKLPWTEVVKTKVEEPAAKPAKKKEEGK